MKKKTTNAALRLDKERERRVAIVRDIEHERRALDQERERRVAIIGDTLRIADALEAIAEHLEGIRAILGERNELRQ